MAGAASSGATAPPAAVPPAAGPTAHATGAGDGGSRTGIGGAGGVDVPPAARRGEPRPRCRHLARHRHQRRPGPSRTGPVPARDRAHAPVEPVGGGPYQTAGRALGRTRGRRNRSRGGAHTATRRRPVRPEPSRRCGGGRSSAGDARHRRGRRALQRALPSTSRRGPVRRARLRPRRPARWTGWATSSPSGTWARRPTRAGRPGPTSSLYRRPRPTTPSSEASPLTASARSPRRCRRWPERDGARGVPRAPVILSCAGCQ